jgi:hypothetical protein
MLTKHVLRKSYGPWSAGTEVDLMAEAFYIDDEPIPTDLVVERRPRTVMVPVGPNSKERRKTKREKRKAALLG